MTNKILYGIILPAAATLVTAIAFWVWSAVVTLHEVHGDERYTLKVEFSQYSYENRYDNYEREIRNLRIQLSNPNLPAPTRAVLREEMEQVKGALRRHKGKRSR